MKRSPSKKTRATGTTGVKLTRERLIALIVTLAALGILAVRNRLFDPQPLPAPTPAATAIATPGAGGPVGAVGIDLHVYPDDDEQALLELISQAKERVFMKVYLLTDQQVIDAMKVALKNGADVRAMLEESPFGGAGTTKQMFQKLKSAGVDVKYANPTFRFTHEKSFVVDDQAIIMTANMTKAAFTRNREFLVITNDPADVAEVAASFKADWDREAFTPASPRLVWSPVTSRERINSVIKSATRTIEVYAEVAEDEGQIGLLVDAVKRGVAVRLVTSPPGSGEGESEGLDALQAGGVRVRYVKSPYIHAKLVVADGAFAFVGSVNITTTSLDFNRELGILLSDQPAIERARAAFEKDWNKGVDR